MQEIITKLKDKTQVKAFGLMEPVEREVYEKVGKENLLFYTNYDNWIEPMGGYGHFKGTVTYAIKPDYQPEPEFVDLEIRQAEDFLGIEAGRVEGVLINVDFTRLSYLVDDPNFQCFWSGESFAMREAFWVTGTVASIKANGKKVWARFRNESNSK